jgi:hypothetical protein
MALTGQMPAAFGQAVVFTGIPHFLPAVSYTVPGATMAALADVNGDGILDIVTANGLAPTGDGGVSVLLGNGDGTFKPAMKIAAGGSPTMVVVGDFNNDGRPDIAVSNSPSPDLLVPVVGGPPVNSVSIYFGNGDGTFRAPINTPTLGAFGMFAADFNGDGKLDLAVTTATVVQILLNNGNGTFTVKNTTVPAFSARILGGDFNGDGSQDLLVFGTEMLGNGDGTFTVSPAQVLRGAGFLADFNGDGIPDLTEQDVARGKFFVGLLSFGLPGGTWAPSFLTSVTSFGPGVAADFNGDGKLDIYGGGWPPLNVANDNPPAPGGLFLGHGDGTFTRVSYGLSQFFGSGSTAVGDLDGNGSPDLVLTGTDANGELSVQVALNTFGHPPLLAQLTASSVFTVGGGPIVTGTVSLGGPAPAAGSSIALSSSSPAVSFPNGRTVTIPAGLTSATFPIATSVVGVPTPVSISASNRATTLTTLITVLKSPTLASISIAPASLFGQFGGDPAVGTVTLTSPASEGVTVNLVSAKPAVLSVGVSTVAMAPGATTATFPVRAQAVSADTPVTVSGSFQGTTRSATVTVLKELPSVAITKSQYTVKNSNLQVEATSTKPVANLQVYNAATGAFLGSIPAVGGGKYVGQLFVTGVLTSIAVQSSVGGLATASVPNK